MPTETTQDETTQVWIRNQVALVVGICVLVTGYSWMNSARTNSSKEEASTSFGGCECEGERCQEGAPPR